MLLAAGAVSEIVRVVQIICWIILPVLLLAILLTVFLHYRKKKKNREESLPAEELLPVPAMLVQGKTPADYILFDHSGLVHQYHNKLCHSQARYTALRHDFSRLETKYTALAVYASHQTDHPKATTMENSVSLSPVMQEEIDLLIKKHKAEKQEWREKNEQLAHSYRSLEQENNLLQAKLELATATEEGRSLLVNKWTEENSMLKDKLAEHDYLQDIVEEKKSQIAFLQNQLEQRVILHHSAGHQTAQLQQEIAQLKTLQNNTSEELAEHKNQLQQSRETTDKLNTASAEKEEQLQQKEQELQSKQEQIVQLQELLQQLRLEQEASVTARQQEADTFKNELNNQHDILHATSEKLTACKQHMRRFYEEFEERLA
jgi:chromosome segregation ATPase